MRPGCGGGGLGGGLVSVPAPPGGWPSFRLLHPLPDTFTASPPCHQGQATLFLRPQPRRLLDTGWSHWPCGSSELFKSWRRGSGGDSAQQKSLCKHGVWGGRAGP